jgi:hypothetical protein
MTIAPASATKTKQPKQKQNKRIRGNVGKKEWREDAACINLPKKIFFPEPCATEGSYTQAKKICDSCPVTKQCLDLAMRSERGERCRHGMFGGKTPKERYVMDKTLDAPITTPIKELPRWLR